MNNKHFLLLLIALVFFNSCAEDNDVGVPRDLDEFLETVENIEMGGVIACAASEDARDDLTYIFYYPEDGATDIRYYEADTTVTDKTDFSNYRRQVLDIEDVFGGKLQRFTRSDDTSESWCLVTYFLDGVLQVSNPILLKNASQQTQWEDDLEIEFPTTLEPEFTWSDFDTTSNEIYFQAIYETDADEFVSGTYTTEQFFKYYDTSNVTLNINTETPPDLEEDVEYLFTLMGVSDDNWVNLVVEETFVPQNLEEYLNNNVFNDTQRITSFGLSENESTDDVYVYFHPLENARDFRYYETNNTTDDETDLANYRRKFLTNDTDFGAQLRRFSRTNTEDSWCIVTYEIDDEIYRSEPILIQVAKNPTQYETIVDDISQQQTLMPVFTWSDFDTTENQEYLFILTETDDTFVSGIFTEQQTFQYYDVSNTTGTINTEEPPVLILDDEYDITIYGISNNNWVNLAIQTSFEAK